MCVFLFVCVESKIIGILCVCVLCLMWVSRLKLFSIGIIMLFRIRFGGVVCMVFQVVLLLGQVCILVQLLSRCCRQLCMLWLLLVMMMCIGCVVLFVVGKVGVVVVMGLVVVVESSVEVVVGSQVCVFLMKVWLGWWFWLIVMVLVWIMLLVCRCVVLNGILMKKVEFVFGMLCMLIWL